MEMILEAIMDFLVSLWEEHMHKRGKQRDISKDKKLIRIFKVISWNILVLAGGLLILLILGLVAFLIMER